MRTTVTLDPDAEQIVRERMAAKGVSFKRALNDAIRAGVHTPADVLLDGDVRHGRAEGRPSQGG